MDAFLSQIQPYLDQAQIAARQIYGAALANPTVTSAFAAVFLLLVFLRRRRRRKSQIAEQILDRHERLAAQATSDAAPATQPDARPKAAPAVPPDRTAEPARAAAPAPQPSKPAPTPAPAEPDQADALQTAAAEPARTRAAPLVLDTPAPAQTTAPATKAAQPAAATPKPAPTSQPDATKRAATGPKVIHVLRRITRAADTGHSVDVDVPLSKLLAATDALSHDDLSRTIDFGIFDAQGSLIAAIEDHTDTPKGHEPTRDAAKRELLRQAGIPVTELLAGFTEAQLAAHLNKLMGAA